MRKSLAPLGAFVEGDYIVSVEEESRLLKEYQELKKSFPLLEDGQYHVDIPFSEKTQLRVLKDAGFSKIDIIFRTSRSNIVVARPNRRFFSSD